MERVIIIGAGFAGLTTAMALADRGVDVLVLEARHRVGGRVWSERMETPGGELVVIERGAEFVLDGYTALRALADRYDLELADTGMSYYVREPRGLPGVDVEAAQRAGAELARAAVSSTASSVAQLVARSGLAGAVAEAVLARVEISSALEGDRLHPSVLEHVGAFAPLPSHRIAGGNQGLALAMAHQLGARVRLGTPVRAIVCSDDGPRVHTDDDDLTAERIVLAVPLPVLRDLPIAPALPAWKQEAIARVELGHAAKLHVPLRATPGTSAVMSVPDRFWCWTATNLDGSVAAVLNCFAGSPSALRRLGIEQGPAAWLDRIAVLRPDLDPAGEAAVLTTWSDDPWARAAYRADGSPAQPGDDLLEAPVGRLHFAGEYAGGAWSGLMEGALRTGFRVAAEVHDAVSAPT
jgi:monoamine oxidase